MRVCKYCNCKMNDNQINCPLCGAHTDVVDASVPMVSGSYPQKGLKKPVKLLVRDIFIGLTSIILMAFLVSSIMSHNWALFLVATSCLAFVWLTILQYVFYPHNTRQILSGIFTWTIIFINAVFLHYYFHGMSNALNISIGIISPILLSILNVVFLMIVFIGGNWYRYAFQTIVLCSIEIIWLIAVLLLKFNAIASIVSASIGFVTIAFSFVFGREVIYAEFKKRFHF
ncbi:MAG: DUF6320 domain-containing protein [Christensenella sp.]|nr:DUF6320 domain-containing protein [Christensenella sp.]